MKCLENCILTTAERIQHYYIQAEVPPLSLLDNPPIGRGGKIAISLPGLV